MQLCYIYRKSGRCQRQSRRHTPEFIFISVFSSEIGFHIGTLLNWSSFSSLKNCRKGLAQTVSLQTEHTVLPRQKVHQSLKHCEHQYVSSHVLQLIQKYFIFQVYKHLWCEVTTACSILIGKKKLAVPHVRALVALSCASAAGFAAERAETSMALCHKLASRNLFVMSIPPLLLIARVSRGIKLHLSIPPLLLLAPRCLYSSIPEDLYLQIKYFKYFITEGGRRKDSTWATAREHLGQRWRPHFSHFIDDSSQSCSHSQGKNEVVFVRNRSERGSELESRLCKKYSSMSRHSLLVYLAQEFCALNISANVDLLRCWQNWLKNILNFSSCFLHLFVLLCRMNTWKCAILFLM